VYTYNSIAISNAMARFDTGRYGIGINSQITPQQLDAEQDIKYVICFWKKHY